MTRGAAALSLVFLGLATGFAGFSLVAMERGGAAATATVVGLAIAVAGIRALPPPPPPDA